MTCFVKMKYQMFHRSTRARRQKCNNLLTEANSLNRTSRIYIHDSNDLSEETVKLKLCGRLHKKHSYNWSTSPIGPVISGVPFTCACPYAVTLVNRGQPHKSRSAACEFPAQTEQNQHKQRVNRIFRGWIWREREWGCCWTELMGDLGVISLAWRPPLNKDQLSRTQYKSPGMGRAGGGRQWEEMGKDPWDIRRKWMSCIIKEVMSGCARDEGKEQESFHLFTNNLCLSPSMEIINADPRGPPHGAQHTAVCVWIHLSLYIHALARSPPLSRSLSVIHFLAGRVRVQWHVSGIDAAARW